jgi:hypothetical protein
LKRPPLPPERNPLLGRWTRPQTGRQNSSDPFASLQALADFEGPDRINWSGQNVRWWASDLRRASLRYPIGAAAGCDNEGFPSTDSGAGGATSRGTLLSSVAGLHYPSGKYFPPAGTTFYVLKESLDAALIRSGLQPLPGVSPLRAWIMACEAKQDATIRPI